jgi:hypothetical protein
MMILTISILYCKYLYFSYTLNQSSQSLTLTKFKMQDNLGRMGLGDRLKSDQLFWRLDWCATREAHVPSLAKVYMPFICEGNQACMNLSPWELHA